MAAKRQGRPLHGWLVIDKPPGLTSSNVVTRVIKFTGAAKAGHGGTLDPIATGVLPLALGEATKMVAYVLDGAKQYRFTVRWGEARTTDDREGAVTATSPVRPTSEAIRAVLPAFTGVIDQVPPTHSAVKVEGRRAYALARANEPVDLKPRRIRIDRFDLVAIPDADHAEFEVAAGKGAYMRSLARDIAHRLDTYGHVTALRRLAVGPFNESHAIPLDKLESLGHSPALERTLLPVETVLAGIPALALTEAEARRLKRGQPVSLLAVASRTPLSGIDPESVVCAMAEGRMVALARIKGGEIRPFRVLNL